MWVFWLLNVDNVGSVYIKYDNLGIVDIKCGYCGYQIRTMRVLWLLNKNNAGIVVIKYEQCGYYGY